MSNCTGVGRSVHDRLRPKGVCQVAKGQATTQREQRTQFVQQKKKFSEESAKENRHSEIKRLFCWEILFSFVTALPRYLLGLHVVPS